MRKAILTLSAAIVMAITSIQASQAQQQYTQLNSDGQAVTKYRPTTENIDGSPWLNDAWSQGTILNSAGTTFTNVSIKFDVANDRLIYLEGAEQLLFKENIKKFTMDGRTFINGLPAVDSLTSISYYELIADGKVKLLKHYIKRVVASPGYGSAVTNYRYSDKAAFYIYKDVKMYPVKLDKKSVLQVLSDKSEQIDTYLASHKVNFKKNEDLAALVTYYNSLVVAN